MTHLPAPPDAALSASIERAAGGDSGDRPPVRLDGFAFRLAPPAGPTDPHGEPAGPWTLARTLATLRARRAVLVSTDRGVRLVHAGRPPAALSRALEAHGPTLRHALRLGVLDYSVPAPWSAGEWDDATRLHAAWFGLEFSPAGAVELSPGVRVADIGRLRDSVARALAAGPAAAGAGRLSRDLASLYARYGSAATRLQVVAPNHAKAA